MRNAANACAIILAGLLALPLGAMAATKAAFCLPDVIYAAPSVECNVYFGSAFDTVSPRAYSFDAQCAVGRCQNERWTWTPNAADGGRSQKCDS